LSPLIDLRLSLDARLNWEDSSPSAAIRLLADHFDQGRVTAAAVVHHAEHDTPQIINPPIAATDRSTGAKPLLRID